MLRVQALHSRQYEDSARRGKPALAEHVIGIAVGPIAPETRTEGKAVGLVMAARVPTLSRSLIAQTDDEETAH